MLDTVKVTTGSVLTSVVGVEGLVVLKQRLLAPQVGGLLARIVVVSLVEGPLLVGQELHVVVVLVRGIVASLGLGLPVRDVHVCVVFPHRGPQLLGGLWPRQLLFPLFPIVKVCVMLRLIAS